MNHDALTTARFHILLARGRLTDAHASASATESLLTLPMISAAADLIQRIDALRAAVGVDAAAASRADDTGSTT